MSVQAERSVFLCTCPLSQLQLTERAIHSVLPAQLEEGTEVYAINEILTSYSFVRRAIPCRYLPSRLRHSGRYPPVLPLYSLVLGQYFIHILEVFTRRSTYTVLAVLNIVTSVHHTTPPSSLVHINSAALILWTAARMA